MHQLQAESLLAVDIVKAMCVNNVKCVRGEELQLVAFFHQRGHLALKGPLGLALFVHFVHHRRDDDVAATRRVVAHVVHSAAQLLDAHGPVGVEHQVAGQRADLEHAAHIAPLALVADAHDVIGGCPAAEARRAAHAFVELELPRVHAHEAPPENHHCGMPPGD